MSNLTAALIRLRPRVDFSNIDDTYAHVEWGPELPEGFVAPTANEVAAIIARFSVPASIANWKAHAILKVDGKHQDVVAVINAITDPVKRELVMTAFERLDPLPRDSATLVELLIAAGYDEPGIDDVFVRGNALQIDPD